MEYRVLVPIDDDVKRATAQARTVIGLPHSSEAVVATVFHTFPDDVTGDLAAIDEIAAGRRVVEELETNGVTVERMIGRGEPAEAILAASDEIGADQIIIGGRKRSPLGSMLFGSITQAVILDATIPVTVTGNTAPMKPTHICESCGKRYYSAKHGGITTCQACGGTKVHAV